MSGRPIPYKELLDAARHATGFVRQVPGKEHVMVAANPQWLGGEHWAIVRHGDNPDEGTVWTGGGWEFPMLPTDQIYRWTLAQVIAEHTRAVADLSQEPTSWRAQHHAPDDLNEEFFAEFAPKETAA